MSTRRGIILLKDLGKQKIIVRGIRLLTERLGISDCTGDLPFNKDQTQTKQVRTRILATLSLIKKECNSLVWIETQYVFAKIDCPKDSSRSSSGSPKADR